MCGIVGCVGKNKDALHTLIDGLKKLEYRGYDSAGIAYLENNNLNIIKSVGELKNLEEKIDFNKESNIGIGHTRWATHGVANENNSHPHKVGKFTIVHNGIIENYNELRNELEEKGYIFNSDTDTETVSALLDYIYKSNNDILKTIEKLKEKLVGSYALGIMCESDKNNIYAVKNKSPLIIGIDDNVNYIASDVPAILDKTKKYIVLEDGDYAKISANEVLVYNNGIKKEVNVKEFEFDGFTIDKDGYEHYMLKEMHEEPVVFKKTISPYLENGIDSLIEKMPDFTKYNKIRVVACGSATHAGLVGKCLIENYANILVQVDIASEFRYSKQFLDKDELVILISQSGETADTLEALSIAKKNGNDTLGIINAKGSTIAREAKIVLYTEAGREIAVATTKAYSAQVALLSLIALNIAYKNNNIDKKEIIKLLEDVKKIPNYIEDLLNDKDTYINISKTLKNYNDIFFIGRGVDYALAMEGSLKLKEISYSHSEAYAAGELKHGTISLIDEGIPVIAIVTDDNIASKTISNIKEVKSRGANVIYITNKDEKEDNFYDTKIIVPKVHYLLQPLLTIIPLQMMAYYLAKEKGCNIDKPKNLAKSVTVE